MCVCRIEGSVCVTLRYRTTSLSQVGSGIERKMDEASEERRTYGSILLQNDTTMIPVHGLAFPPDGSAFLVHTVLDRRYVSVAVSLAYDGEWQVTHNKRSVVMSADKLCLSAEEAVDKTSLVSFHLYQVKASRGDHNSALLGLRAGRTWVVEPIFLECISCRTRVKIQSPTATQLDAQVHLLHACLYRWGVLISSVIRSVCFVSVVFRVVLSSSCWWCRVVWANRVGAQLKECVCQIG